ncbi:MAG: acetolactate synthase small subunit [Lachnospiraceae bacterium]|nr:acetolactate synthase small subunit [Lachnospiraceae bacterium]
MDKIVVAILVENRYGVLNRITGMFRRKGFNIDTLTVGETADPEVSRITISFRSEDDKEQIIKQLEKMPVVKKVKELDNASSVSRELLLIKLKNDQEKRQELMTVSEVFRTKIVDYTNDDIIIEATGPSKKIDAFIEVVKPYGILEMCRTGVSALSRGADDVLNV